jgi:predicted membrane channel-forming protein YqfA (hemolysin III family)
LLRMRALLLSLQARVRQMLDRPAKSVAPQSSDLPICSSGSQRANKPSSCSRPRSRRRTSAKKRGRSVSEAQSPARVAPDQIFSAGEELAHSVTHGVGLLLAIAALVLMVVFAARIGSVLHVVSCAIYGVTLVVLYASSTLYHGLPAGGGKRVFGILDHAAIFLLIAGTYTPFLLVTLSGALGWSLFAVIWGLAVGGVVLEAVSRGRARRIQLVLYRFEWTGEWVRGSEQLTRLPARPALASRRGASRRSADWARC